MRALDWLYSLQTFGVKLGLGNMQRLLGELEAPAEPPLTFHVAGTNGKGSVCAFLDSIARAHGLRTGLFTSPHLVRFQERVRVDGVAISEASLDRWLLHLREVISDWDPHPSFFEVTLALAMAHFHEAGAECLVLETGLGGRLDATNAVATRHVCVITPIHYDHTQVLGETLTEIAREKAGIFRSGVPIVSATQFPEAEVALRQAAAEIQAPIQFVDASYDGDLQLAGEHQRHNAALARTAFQQATNLASEESIRQGLKAARWPGRFERFEDRFIVDGAHNPGSVEALCRTWKEEMSHARPTIVFGCARDKDPDNILEMLGQIAKRFIFVPVQSGRSEDPSKLAELIDGGTTAKDFSEGLKLASTHPEPILITGSLFLAGEAIAHFTADSAPLRTEQ